MRIVSKKGEFDLPIDFEVEITICNPFLSDMGEQSVPFSLPATDNNLYLLGYGNRFDSLYKPLESLKVQVMDGLMCKVCQMRVNSIDGDSINSTLYLGSSDFYEQINDVNLQSLDWDVIETDAPTLKEKILWLLEKMTNLYKNPESEYLHDKFVVVPVATTENAEDITGYKELWGEYPAKYKRALERFKRHSSIVLNDFAHAPASYLFSEQDELGFRRFQKLQGDALVCDEGYITTHLSRRLKINGEDVEVGLGYGVTPFYRLIYVLRKIFSSFGYELVGSSYSFGEDILLNNVADALFEGKIQGNQLVPFVKIKDFLLKVEKMYSIRFVFDEITRKVKPVKYYSFFLEDIEDDLSSFVCGQLVRGKPNFEELIIERNNSKKLTSSSQSKKKKTIKIDTLTEKMSYGQSFLVYIDNDGDFHEVNIYPVVQKIGGVAHLNSVKINGENTEEEETHSMKEVRICGYETDTDYYASEGLSIKYNRSVPSSVEDTGVFGGVDSLELSYQEYKEFLSSSNVPVEVDLLLSKSEIQRLDITKPYLLFNRKVFFEKLTYKLGADNKCKAVFRTVDKYIDRS